MRFVARNRAQANEHNLPERSWGWWDMFVHENDDPRADGNWENIKHAVLVGFLSDRRLALEMKCMGLNADRWRFVVCRRLISPCLVSFVT